MSGVWGEQLGWGWGGRARREARSECGLCPAQHPPPAPPPAQQCREPLRPGEYRVCAAPAGETRGWHPACFACQACGQALLHLIYFSHDGRLYCGRHHAELLRPRCPACDQVRARRGLLEGAAQGPTWQGVRGHLCQYRGVKNSEPAWGLEFWAWGPVALCPPPLQAESPRFSWTERISPEQGLLDSRSSRVPSAVPDQARTCHNVSIRGRAEPWVGSPGDRGRASSGCATC